MSNNNHWRPYEFEGVDVSALSAIEAFWLGVEFLDLHRHFIRIGDPNIAVNAIVMDVHQTSRDQLVAYAERFGRMMLTNEEEVAPGVVRLSFRARGRSVVCCN